MSKSHHNRPFFFLQRNYSLKSTHPDDQILSFIVTNIITGGLTHFQLALFCRNSIYSAGSRKLIDAPSKLDRRPSKICWLPSSLATTFEAIQVSIMAFRDFSRRNFRNQIREFRVLKTMDFSLDFLSQIRICNLKSLRAMFPIMCRGNQDYYMKSSPRQSPTTRATETTSIVYLRGSWFPQPLWRYYDAIYYQLEDRRIKNWRQLVNLFVVVHIKLLRLLLIAHTSTPLSSFILNHTSVVGPCS